MDSLESATAASPNEPNEPNEPDQPVVTTEHAAPRREMDPHLLLIALLAVIALLVRW